MVNEKRHKKLVLVGGGGHCKSVLDSVLKTREYTEVVITDPSLKRDSSLFGCRNIGGDEMLPVLKEQGFDYAFITVGSIETAKKRKELVDKAKKMGFIIPYIIDPSATVSEFSQIGDGTFIGKKTVINADAKIGEHCIINTGAVLEHECSIGDFTHVAVGTIICGNVSIGEESFIGAGSIIIQGKKIGNNVIIGAGSTVLSDVGNNMKMYGIIKHA